MVSVHPALPPGRVHEFSIVGKRYFVENCSETTAVGKGPDGPRFSDKGTLPGRKRRTHGRCSALGDLSGPPHRQKEVEMHAIRRSGPLKTYCLHRLDQYRQTRGRNSHHVHRKTELVAAGSGRGHGKCSKTTFELIEKEGLLFLGSERRGYDNFYATLGSQPPPPREGDADFRG